MIGRLGEGKKKVKSNLNKKFEEGFTPHIMQKIKHPLWTKKERKR